MWRRSPTRLNLLTEKPLISVWDGAVHAREDEVIRLGGSSHGWPATGGHGEVVSFAPNDLGSVDAVLSITIDHFTALLLRNDTWLEHGVAVIGDLRLSGTVSSLSAALADVTFIPSIKTGTATRVLPKSHGV